MTLKDLENKLKQVKERRDSQHICHEKFNYSGLLTDLFSGLVVGAALGYFADRYLGTLPLFVFILTILGITGGFYNFYKELKNLEHKTNKREDNA